MALMNCIQLLSMFGSLAVDFNRFADDDDSFESNIGIQWLNPRCLGASAETEKEIRIILMKEITSLVDGCSERETWTSPN